MFLFDTQLFWYRLVFIGELVIAEFLYTYKLKKRKLFALRFFAFFLLCETVTFLFPILAFNAAYTSFMFLALFAVSVAGLKFCYDVPLMHLIFCGLAAYSTQHLAYEVYNLIVVATGLDEGLAVGAYGAGDGETRPYNAWTALIYGGTYSIIYWLTFLFFADRINKKEDLRLDNVKIIFLAGIIVVFDVVLNAVITYNSNELYNTLYVIVTHIFNISCCLFALTVQFDLLTQKKMEKELDTIQQLWKKDREQYNLAKENIDIINMKCHDLRHQIREIGRQRVLDESAIKEIESAVHIYDSTIKTGNEALDVILTDKSLYCNKNGITISNVIDGENCNFMSRWDIYSLFGNALENAIESVSRLKDPEKRLINLIVRKTGSFLSVHIDNCFEGELRLVDGLPVTTKENGTFSHGFGVKSIRAIAEKYNGDMTIVVEDNVFNLNLLFPLNESEGTESK